ncbi:MAG: glutamate formimidoyltransferase [Saprospiraceae bacterium]|nr:glutamate formimidoyltransferase [Saprospiraceae bacterium]
MNAQKILECVPNFSEGRDESVIRDIETVIAAVAGVRLLHTDMGKATHRTVVSFAGSPEAVVEAAFQAIRVAASRIDMQRHQGAHPRIGATDVCPLIPIRGMNLEEASQYAQRLARRVGEELGIPVYLYEASASAPHRRNLADIRSGEYEGLEEKMKQAEWKPDFGPQHFQPRVGATVIGAREVLVAYNVNLNTQSVALANAIAYDVREAGRPLKDPQTGKLLRDAAGEVLRSPGMCPGVKAIGWYIPEYGIAQVSMNLTSLGQTQLHEAFEACRKSAEAYGVLVTGSELVGLVPASAMTEAGRHFLKKQRRSTGVGDVELVRVAIQSLGLNSLAPFHPKERIIEYMIQDQPNPLVAMSLAEFARETASENPAPGGGSVSACVGAFGISLGAMVANLSAHKKGLEQHYERFCSAAEVAQSRMQELLNLVDEDTRAFNAVLAAFRMPKQTPEEKKARKKAIRSANLYAMEIPFRTMQIAEACLDIVAEMVEIGNQNSITDACVGALCLRTAVQGAAMNVRINSLTIDDEEVKARFLQKTTEIEQIAGEKVERILATLREKFQLDNI